MAHRTPIEELELRGSRNLKRAKQLPPKQRTAKLPELEALWSELMDRKAEAQATIKKEGMLLKQDKFSARGELYWVWIRNPLLSVVQATERQLVALARLLVEDVEGDREKSPSQVMHEADEFLKAAGVKIN